MGALFSHLERSAPARPASASAARWASTRWARRLAPLRVRRAAGRRRSGPKLALLLIAAGYLALTSRRRAGASPSSGRRRGAALALALCRAAAGVRRRARGRPRGQLPRRRDGRRERGRRRRWRRAAAHQQSPAGGQQRHVALSTRARRWLPLLLHPAPRRALFLGLGTGVTAVVGRRGLALQVDAVELLPEVIAASRHFPRALDAARPRPPARDGGRCAPLRARQRRSLRRHRLRQLPPGAQRLGLAVHGGALRRPCASGSRAGGVFCQWLPLHQLDLDDPAQHRAVLPGGLPARLGAARQQQPGDAGARPGRPRATRAASTSPALRARLARATLPRRVGGAGARRRIRGAGQLRRRARRRCARFAGDAAANTDDHPVVAYRAPRITYAPDSLPRERLIALLRRARRSSRPS